MFKIKEFRKRLSLKQKDLAEKAGISLNSVRRYESGERAPKADAILKLADTLECTPNDLLGVEEKSTEEVMDEPEAIAK